MARDASGTAWLPDRTPVFAFHGSTRSWHWMVHQNLFVQYINDGGARGDDHVGSINWVMGMAQRQAAGGALTLRGMASIEPLSTGECGYPTLLATGESCNGAPLHDRQHPHDLFMELGAQYQRELPRGFAYQLYGALAGEPALGPVAFPHRASAFPNPLAPMSHHWLDSTHVTYGVVTAGLYQRRWKAEASLFNGREPDENRYDLDLAAMDSYSGRVWFLPNERWAFQFSAGHLREAELELESGLRRDVDRITASMTYHHGAESGPFWATSVAWGQNREDGQTTNALLAESSYTMTRFDTVFARGELNEKSAHDLVLPDHHDERVFTVGKLQAGYVRHLGEWSSLVPGVGASVSLSFVPRGLEALYGGRAKAGVAVFFSLRPAQMIMGNTDHQHP